MKRILAPMIIASAFLLVTSSTVFTEEDTHACPKTVIYHDGALYKGCMEGEMRHGPGIYTWPDGSEYRGYFFHDKAHGDGIYLYPDGRTKKVSFNMGTMVSARMVSPSSPCDGCFFGEYICNGRYRGWYMGNRVKGYIPHGRGIMVYTNGSVYSGQWKNGRMHGNGMIRWEDGSSYAGQWLQGKRSGYGIYHWSNGNRYIGKWEENRMCGDGTFYHADGRIVTGFWKEGMISPENW